MSENSGFGKFIERHRIASGYKSQRRLADKTGISSATISRIEAEIQKPEPETLKILAKHLHTTSLVELMVVCGYWDEDELLEPIQEAKESPSAYTAKELSEISIEELERHTLTYKGHVLTDEQKKHLVKLLQAAAEMLEQKK
ncbi:helix-turn-helix domain-containing protein [Paenibacillus ginsengihumi]|uniref:helix-turn-helix domain-containing protein n=1 Tax=Paenibacillus ginsengihumi TaxID=431596 RepID=UPI000367B4E1|nr:helix-turn-helix transcriptional regulator [Paenibacillus ginsengihumi]